MSNLKSRVTRLEDWREAQRLSDAQVNQLTRAQVPFLNFKRLSYPQIERIVNRFGLGLLTDAQLDQIIGDEGRWLESLSDEELQAIAEGEE